MSLLWHLTNRRWNCSGCVHKGCHQQGLQLRTVRTGCWRRDRNDCLDGWRLLVSGHLPRACCIVNRPSLAMTTARYSGHTVWSDDARTLQWTDYVPDGMIGWCYHHVHSATGYSIYRLESCSLLPGLTCALWNVIMLWASRMRTV